MLCHTESKRMKVCVYDLLRDVSARKKRVVRVIMGRWEMDLEFLFPQMALFPKVSELFRNKS